MILGSKRPRRGLAVGLAAIALGAVLGLAFWQLAGSAHRARPSPGEAPLGPPPRVDFWERVDLLLFRGQTASAGGGSSAARGAPGGRDNSGGASPPEAAAKPDPYRETADADQRDLAAALARLHLPEERRRSLLEDYRRLRQAWLGADEAAAPAGAASARMLDVDRAGAVVPALPRRAPAGGMTLPPGLPTEFAAYLQGALAYRDGDLAAARGHWQRLLVLPEEARPYRSTWAAFMLGRVALRAKPRDLEAAVGWFRRTRELAAHGFADSLGLAASSLGWEARAEAARRRFDRAEALYAQQARTGDASAIDSLRIFWRERLIRGFLGR